jgi:kumamolisin
LISKESFQETPTVVPLTIPALVLAFVLALAFAGAGIAFGDSSGDDSGRAEAIAQMTARLPATRTLNLTVALKLHNRDGLEELIREQHDPTSPNYGEWLTPAEFSQRFGPTQAEVERVARWLASRGFIIDSSLPSSRLIRFHAAAATTSVAFGIRFAATSDGRLYGNLSDPQLPADIAPLVEWIGGLDNLKAKIVHAHLMRPHPNVDVNLIGDAFGPPDVYSFYDESPLLDATPTPINGSNTDCIGFV